MKQVVTSEKFTINKQDFLRSVLTAALAALVASFGQLLEPWIKDVTQPIPFDKLSLLLTLRAAFATFAGDMIRRYWKQSATVITITPPVTPKENG